MSGIPKAKRCILIAKACELAGCEDHVVAAISREPRLALKDFEKTPLDWFVGLMGFKRVRWENDRRLRRRVAKLWGQLK